MTLSPTIQPDDPGHKISQNSLFQHEIPNVSQVEGSISEYRLVLKIGGWGLGVIFSLFY